MYLNLGPVAFLKAESKYLSWFVEGGNYLKLYMNDYLLSLGELLKAARVFGLFYWWPLFLITSMLSTSDSESSIFNFGLKPLPRFYTFFSSMLIF